MDSIVLMSGGLDSTVLLYEVVSRGFKPLALSFMYGQNHQEKELGCAEAVCEKLGVPQETIDLISVGKHLKSALTGRMEVLPSAEVENDAQPPTYVPFRNTIMFSVACGIAEGRNINSIYYGSQQRDNEGYWDCTDKYVKRMQSVLYLNRGIQIQIRRPFSKMTKTQVVKRGKVLEVDFSKTYSCYRGEEEHCWNCPTCDEREFAFKEANIIDPLFKE